MLDSWLEDEPDADWWLWIRNSIGILATLGYALGGHPATTWGPRIGLLLLIVVLSTAYVASFRLALRLGMPVNVATGVLLSVGASLGVVCAIIAVTPLTFGLEQVVVSLVILMGVRGIVQHAWRWIYSIFSKLAG